METEREKGRKISPKRAKNGVIALNEIKKMDQIGPKMNQQCLEIVFL